MSWCHLVISSNDDTEHLTCAGSSHSWGYVSITCAVIRNDSEWKYIFLFNSILPWDPIHMVSVISFMINEGNFCQEMRIEMSAKCQPFCSGFNVFITKWSPRVREGQQAWYWISMGRYNIDESLQCNDTSHWLDAYLNWSLLMWLSARVVSPLRMQSVLDAKTLLE